MRVKMLIIGVIWWSVLMAAYNYLISEVVKDRQTSLLVSSERGKTKEPIWLKPWLSLSRQDNLSHPIMKEKRKEE
jgi:hypothetical protein